MRRGLTVLIGIILISWSVSVWGHYPEGLTFLAFQWPPGQEPLIDGDLSEWEVVPDAYILNTQDGYDRVYGYPIFYDMVNMEDTPIFASFAVVWTSWSAGENALYIAARVFDDEHFVLSASDKPWICIRQEDLFDVSIDADHSGGPYSVNYYLEKPLDEEGKLKREFWDVVGVQATTYLASWVVPQHFLAETAATWVVHPPWFEGGVDYWDGIIPERLTSYERHKLEEFKARDWLTTDWRVQAGWEQLVKEVGASSLISQWNVTTYELKIVPFDSLNWRGPEESLVHSLEEGQIIGLNYGFQDKERGGPQGGFIYRSLSDYGHPSRNASCLADFLLASVDKGKLKTFLEISTWGRIKASFKP